MKTPWQSVTCVMKTYAARENHHNQSPLAAMYLRHIFLIVMVSRRMDWRWQNELISQKSRLWLMEMSPSCCRYRCTYHRGRVSLQNYLRLKPGCHGMVMLTPHSSYPLIVVHINDPTRSRTNHRCWFKRSDRCMLVIRTDITPPWRPIRLLLIWTDSNSLVISVFLLSL